MGERTVMQESLFYGFSLERHVPADHMLRSIDRFVDLYGIRQHLELYYSPTGRPSIDPELMIRMLIHGYCFGIRSERRLCDEVHLNLACRSFCRLGLDGTVPDHSTLSSNRHGNEDSHQDCAVEQLVNEAAEDALPNPEALLVERLGAVILAELAQGFDARRAATS